MKTFLLIVLLLSVVSAKITTYRTCNRDLQGLRSYSTVECNHSTLGDHVVCFNFRKDYICTNEGTGDYRWTIE